MASPSQALRRVNRSGGLEPFRWRGGAWVAYTAPMVACGAFSAVLVNGAGSISFGSPVVADNRPSRKSLIYKRP
jgi:hypothetical protein